jgi:hypothetical protein
MNTKDPLDQKLIRSLWFAIGATLLLLIVLGLVGCSAKMDDVGGTTLTPLPTEVEDPEAAFLELVLMANPKAYELMNDTELLEQGQQYCKAAEIGMTHSGMHNNINEAAYTQEQQELEHIILHQALTWLCPEQEYRINP